MGGITPSTERLFSYLVLLLVSTVLAVTITTSMPTTSSALQSPMGFKLVRAPTEVYSGQPVLVFAYVPSGGSVVLKVAVTIEARINVSGLQPPSPTTLDYSVVMIPVLWARGWYLAYIPGLPAKTLTFKVEFPLRTVVAELKVISRVEYKLVVNGSAVASDSYTVQEAEALKKIPPLVYASLYDVLEDRGLIEETLGLGPRGWTTAEGREVKILVIAFDESDVPETSFEYSVSGGSWTSATLVDSPITDSIRTLITNVNDAVKNIENWARQFKPDLALPRAKLTFRIVEASIPAQRAGSYVMFRAVARDVDDNTVASPMGLYYVVNTTSDTKILIVDPHVWLWLLKENIGHLYNALKPNTDYGVLADVVAPLQRLEEVATTIAEYGVEQFHHWEYLGERYNVYIAWPSAKAAELLNILKPNVIILSDLGLGLEYSDVLNWDLRNITIDRETLLSNITSYIKQNHAGLIATHSTLSDWIVWLGCEEKVKIGARGHVGYSLEDADILEEKTVAALLGMPELALWEYVRDKVAEALCKAAESLQATQPYYAAIVKSAALLIGSMPLQVSHVPWNGTLKLTVEAEALGWDLPSEFTVEIPGLNKQFGLKAYTEVGWQLALPRVLAYVAWSAASDARIDFTKLRTRIVGLLENATKGAARASDMENYLDKALERGIHDFYRALSTARMRGHSVNITILIPGTNETLSIAINITRESLVSLLQKLPVKIVVLSPRGLAGIIVHDKFWDPSGYRAVYFSFEVEAAEGEIAKKLFVNAVEWVKKWRYKDITELLGGVVRVPKEVAVKFKDAILRTPGKEVFSDGLLLNEEGGSEIELNVSPGRLYLIIAHPTTDTVHVKIEEGPAKIINITKVDVHVTQVVVEVSESSALVVSLRAGSDSSLNSAYVVAKLESAVAVTPTPATATTTTITMTTTVTETATVTTTVTKTVATPTTETTTATTTVVSTTTEVMTTPITVTTSVREYITVPTTIVSSSVETVRATEWTPGLVMGIVLFVVGVAIGLAIKRR